MRFWNAWWISYCRFENINKIGNYAKHILQLPLFSGPKALGFWPGRWSKRTREAIKIETEEKQQVYDLLDKIYNNLSVEEIKLLYQIRTRVEWLQHNFQAILKIMLAGGTFSEEETNSLIAKSEHPCLKGFLPK